MILAAAGGAAGQTNLLRNPGFEYGLTNSAWTGITDWQSGEPFGGVLRGLDPGQAHSGSNVLQMYAFGLSDHALYQDWTVTPGRVYSTEAWMMSPAGTNYFTPTNGFVFVSMELYSGSGATLLSLSTPVFGQGGPTNWTLYRSQPVLAPANTASGRTYCLYVRAGDATVQGAVYIDDALVSTTMPSTAGALLNHGFEANPIGNMTDNNIPFWASLGNAGAVASNVAKSGTHAMQIYFTETLIGQTWPATQGVKCATGAWLFQTSSLPFQAADSEALVVLEFFDAQTNKLLGYDSAFFTPQSPTNQWIYYETFGVAPSGTVMGRTLCGIVGPGTMSGSVFFDDATQRVVSTTGTVAGLLRNPGFDDGPKGNAASLDPAGDFPSWDWLGGATAGFVARDYATSEVQALVITFPENLAAQGFAVATGGTYVLEGYIYNPSGGETVLGGTAFGVLIAQVLDGTNVVSQGESAHFVAGMPTDVWRRHIAVVEAPGTGASLTGRVLVAILGDAFEYNGALYFDGLRLQTSATLTAFQQWQYSQFLSTNDPGTGLNEDYDGDGFNNWGEFIAGTTPTSTGSLFEATAGTRTNDEVVIRWSSVAGRIYGLCRLTNLVPGVGIPLASGMTGTPPQNVYTDAAPPVGAVYYKVNVSTN
jgi:hypothetical protein